MSHPAHQEKCPKTNLESRGVLCEAYRLVVLCTVNCTEMAYQKGPTFLSIPEQGYRPYIQMSVYEYMNTLINYKSQYLADRYI